MAPPARKYKKAPKPKDDARTLKRKRDVDEHESLHKAINALDPKAEVKLFSELPLSDRTSRGLERSHFKTLTDIQAKAVPLALKGRDILGAAKTGSGKTLSFLVPVLENLYRQKWSEDDGLGALIISPTRELAVQTFQNLRMIGNYHSFSAGLIIGGSSLKEEREVLQRMNILVCTPGRMLQHLDQTAAFDVGNLQMLVLDEADRIMDMGFKADVDAIIEHLPKERQTILLSATQTKRVSDLARLSLKDPEYVAVHEAASSATPSTLQQYYVVTPLPEKLNTLFGFIKANLKAKIIVFLSSGKQVRFVYESFRRMQPGIPLSHLHGRQKQSARLDITNKFSASTNSCIFATDVVARGLDFPAVDWVIQLDCPEDADTYIHRVGRTARYERVGKAVLFLEPSEEAGMLKRLEHKKVPIIKTNVKEKNKKNIKNQLQDQCFQDPELKYLGQKAFSSYTRSIFLQKDKEVFNLEALDLEAYAASMGLPGAPKIKFQKGDDAKKLKNAPRAALSDDEDSDGVKKAPKKEEVRTKYDRMFERRNQDVLSGHYSKMIAEDDAIPAEHADADEDDDFLSVKRVIAADDSDDEIAVPGGKVITGLSREPIVIDSKRKEKMLKSKKAMLKLKGKGIKTVFDEEGVAHNINEMEDEQTFQQRGTAAEQRARFLEEEAARVQAADREDKQLAKDKKRERREKKKTRATADSDSEGEVPDLTEGDDEHMDPMEFLASLPMAGDEEAEQDRPAKRPKKWFEDDSEDERKTKKRKGRVIEAADEPETLEDLEALAAGLLA